MSASSHLALRFVTLALLAGCSSAAASSDDPARTDSTEGGETPAPIVRTEVPVPVPMPPVPREALLPATERVWTAVEVAASDRPPPPPEASTSEAIETWARGVFAEWYARRVEASQRAEAELEGLRGQPARERGVAAGLIGYLNEQTFGDVRGAPIPDEIAHDAELLASYRAGLLEAAAPIASRALMAYRFCVQAFDELADPAWGEWRAFCEDRGDEVADVGLPASEPAPTTSTETP